MSRAICSESLTSLPSGDSRKLEGALPKRLPSSSRTRISDPGQAWMVGDDIAEEGIRYLQTINFGSKKGATLLAAE